MSENIGRNDPCHCGSGNKYKKCHLEKDEKKDRKVREKAALNAAKVAASHAEKESKGDPSKKSAPPQKQGWFKKVAGKVGFLQKFSQSRMPPRNKGG